MHDHEIARLINLLAVVTPVAAAVLYPALRNRLQDWDRTRIRLLILGLAGPANWLVWNIFNGWLDMSGYRSVAGYALAALVFFGAGAGLGMFRRNRPSASPISPASAPDERPNRTGEPPDSAEPR